MKWYVCLLIVALGLLGGTEAPVQAHPHASWVQASAYGPCCYEGRVEAGLISYDGQTWEGLTPWKSSVASPWHRRGTGVCIEIPPQPDAPEGSGLRKFGAVICDRPLSEAGGDRGPLTVSDHIPTYHSAQGERWDLSYGFLRDWGYCGADESEWRCLKRWGVRWVKVHDFG